MTATIAILQYEQFIIRPDTATEPCRLPSGATIAQMRVRLLAFATARQALGSGELELDIEPGTTLAGLARQLQTEYPELEPIWPRLAVAVDGELSDARAVLQEGSEIALLPPVSGGTEDRRAALVEQAIDLPSLVQSASHPSCGAVLLFVGNVRDHHVERQVAQITYDAYRPMALARLETIVKELEDQAANLHIRVVHRLGEVPVGEASVAIAVASPHRATAYEVSRAVLERLKQEVPIWKLEHYADGQVLWREEEPLA